MRPLIGVDEAGRGALAGPVAVGAAFVPIDFDWGLLPGVRDSKLLSPTARERIFLEAQRLRRVGALDFRVALVGAATIDRSGITRAVALGIARTLRALERSPTDVEVRLDGLLRAPAAYPFQETIVRGDLTEPAISLASIVAKVTRDRHMVRLAPRYASYGFAVHKGYGTKQHRAAIAAHGISDVHRRYFCRGCTPIEAGVG